MYLDDSFVEQVVERYKPVTCFICSSCVHYKKALSEGKRSCGKSFCGGPSKDLSFPLFFGAKKEDKRSFCYVCGKPSVHVAYADRSDKGLGICAEHLDLFKDQINE